MATDELVYQIKLDLSNADKQINKYFDSGSATAKKQGAKTGKAWGTGFASAATAVLGVVSFGAVLGGLDDLIQVSFKYEDALADVAKTTGLTDKELQSLEGSLFNIGNETRTSNEELLRIAENVGRLGYDTEEGVLRMTESFNRLTVALGDDFVGGGDEAVITVGKLNTLFSETAKLAPEDAIIRTGSVLNELAASGNSTAGNIADFSKRLGALPANLRPAIAETTAFGAVLEESGIQSEIASGGLTNFFLVAGKNVGKFAKQMGISEQAAKDLLATNPAEFALQFSESLNGLDPTQLANTLDNLKIGTQETIKVVGVLGGQSDKIRKKTKLASQAFSEGTSVIDEYNKKNNTGAADQAKFANKIQATKKELGDKLAPVLLDVFEALEPLLNGFLDFVENNPELVKGIAIFSLVLTGLVAVLGAVATAMFIVSTVGLPVIAVMLAIAAAVTLVIMYWEQIVNLFNNAPKIFENFVKSATDKLGYFGDLIYSFLFQPIENQIRNIKDLFSSIIDFFTNVFKGDWEGALQSLADIAKNIFNTLADVILFPFDVAIKGINAIIDQINKLSFDVPDWVPSIGGSEFGFDINRLPLPSSVVQLADGGLVGGKNTMALLNDGVGKMAGQEMVMNAPTVSAFKPLLTALNEIGKGGGGVSGSYNRNVTYNNNYYGNQGGGLSNNFISYA